MTQDGDQLKIGLDAAEKTTKKINLTLEPITPLSTLDEANSALVEIKGIDFTGLSINELDEVEKAIISIRDAVKLRQGVDRNVIGMIMELKGGDISDLEDL